MDNGSINRELDALVAEKVMKLMPYSNWKETYGGWLAGECCMHEGVSHKNCFNVKSPPQYSGQMIWAWKVVEKIAENKAIGKKFIESLPDKSEIFDKNSSDVSEMICHMALEVIEKLEKI